MMAHLLVLAVEGIAILLSWVGLSFACCLIFVEVRDHLRGRKADPGMRGYVRAKYPQEESE